MTDYALARGVSQDAGIDRVIVGGKNITDFRTAGRMGPHQPTFVPGYELVEPFGYGESEPLVIPRTNAMFEQVGEGDLDFIYPGALVLYQRVLNAGTEDEQVVTDYRGVVVAPRTSEREITLDVTGELVGRAGAVDRMQPVVRQFRDVGRWPAQVLRYLNVGILPASGFDIGINVPDQGGMTQAAWLTLLGALSLNRQGQQRSIMPNEWGGPNYSFNLKNRTFKSFTLYADGQRVALDLVDDAAERPNIYYGTGTDLNGLRWRNARIPGYFAGPPAPYPFEDNRSFGVGTTNEDTDTEDGITVLRIALSTAGYLDDESDTTVYTDSVADAVDELKDDAGLTMNGQMTPAAWNALWNTDVVGYTAGQAFVYPLVQDPRTRKWNFARDGSIIGKNPAYDPKVLKVTRLIDFGPGVSKQQAANYCRGLYARSQGTNWSGTITLGTGIAAFTGEHDGTDWDTLTSADVLAPRSIRPGQNAWLPYFDGGTLVHVSGARVSSRDANGDRSVTLTVDTQARDMLELGEILNRNRESRRSQTRGRFYANTGRRSSGSMVEHDELYGLLDRDVQLTGGQWNVVRTVVGQSGSVNRTRITCKDASAEFATAIIAGEWGETRFRKLFGNPLRAVPESTGETWIEADRVQKLMEEDRDGERTILNAWGTIKNPCGYGRRNKYGPDGETRTSAPLSGVHVDDASWSYSTPSRKKPFVTIGIYPDRDCVLRHGRLLYALENDAL